MPLKKYSLNKIMTENNPVKTNKKQKVFLSHFLDYCSEKILTNISQKNAPEKAVEKNVAEHYKIDDNQAKELHNLIIAIKKSSTEGKQIGEEKYQEENDRKFIVGIKLDSWSKIASIVGEETLSTHSKETINHLTKIYTDWVKQEEIQVEINLNNIGRNLENEMTTNIVKILREKNSKLREQMDKNYTLAEKKLPWNLTSSDKKNKEDMKKIKELETQEQENSSSFSFLTDIPFKQWIIGVSILTIFVFALIFIWRKFLDRVI